MSEKLAKKTKKTTIQIKKIVIDPKIYLVSIRGCNSMLMNKMPDLSQQATETSQQAKVNKIDIERSIWREKAYFSDQIGVYVPGENIHECLKEGAKYWNQGIPGEGKKTYTDVIASAVVVEDMPLGNGKKMMLDDKRIVPFGKAVNGTPSRGKKSGSKVYKIRPMITSWEGSFLMHVFDSRLTPDILRTVITYAGTFKGLCDWRPLHGRFNLISCEEVQDAQRIE